MKTIFLDLYNWNVFLTICAIPSFIAAVALCFMPESPKFLMSLGATDQALKVFEEIYKTNTGNATYSYPIKGLIDETQSEEYQNKIRTTANRNKLQAMKDGLRNVASLFAAPYGFKVFLVCVIQTALVSG